MEPVQQIRDQWGQSRFIIYLDGRLSSRGHWSTGPPVHWYLQQPGVLLEFIITLAEHIKKYMRGGGECGGGVGSYGEGGCRWSEWPGLDVLWCLKATSVLWSHLRQDRGPDVHLFSFRNVEKIIINIYSNHCCSDFLFKSNTSRFQLKPWLCAGVISSSSTGPWTQSPH